MLWRNGNRLCELIKDCKKHDEKQDEHNEALEKRFVRIELKLIEFPKPEAYGKQSNNIADLDKKIIAIGARQKVYAGITMLILSLIIASIFFIIRSSLANGEPELVQNLHEVECQNLCCKKPIIEVFAEVHDSDIIFHSRTCKLLQDNLDLGNIFYSSIEAVYDKPLYMAFTTFADFKNCDTCNLEVDDTFPCSAFCCKNFSYALDYGALVQRKDKSEKQLPTLHHLTCDVLGKISAYHICFIDRWGDGGFPQLEKTAQLCEECFYTINISPHGDLM